MTYASCASSSQLFQGTKLKSLNLITSSQTLQDNGLPNLYVERNKAQWGYLKEAKWIVCGKFLIPSSACRTTWVLDIHNYQMHPTFFLSEPAIVRLWLQQCRVRKVFFLSAILPCALPPFSLLPLQRLRTSQSRMYFSSHSSGETGEHSYRCSSARLLKHGLGGNMSKLIVKVSRTVGSWAPRSYPDKNIRYFPQYESN